MTPYASLAVILFVFLVSCNTCNQRVEENRSALLGRWEIAQAFRNEKQTETLAGVYFEFGADGKMVTNLPVGPEEPVGYEVTKQEIVQKNTSAITYTIKELTDSTLTLRTELRGVSFELQLQRPPDLPEIEVEMLYDSINNI